MLNEGTDLHSMKGWRLFDGTKTRNGSPSGTMGLSYRTQIPNKTTTFRQWISQVPGLVWSLFDILFVLVEFADNSTSQTLLVHSI